jgi:ribosomal protein S18 acetylase RimI-like enzyme
MKVDLLKPAHERVRNLLVQVPGSERRFLFDGEMWSPVAVVAVARVDQVDVGLATLGADFVGMEAVPAIIGLWVDPRRRGRGIGRELLVALAAESQRRYGSPPYVHPITAGGQGAVEAALAAGAVLTTVDVTAPKEAPTEG